MAMWLIRVKQGHIRVFTYGGIPGRVDLARRYSLGLMGLVNGLGNTKVIRVR